ncbi:HAMP domain-containing protein [Novosphingobium sp. FSY-8]|uniref:histidine kinase n=1 Tax=Novosphingobium ovatum TaxID=1908523 RepID=A0ABW9XAS8_9SPHN|nr:ATP-binding protein [Novosphingobium ovatum]NBC35639.1 HAMP domain-containing protein [Novosphingobium ovatum]
MTVTDLRRRLPLPTGLPFGVQLMALIVCALLAAQLVTLGLTVLFPPEAPRRWDLAQVSRALAGGEVADTLEVRRMAGPPDISQAGWLVSQSSHSALAQQLRLPEHAVVLGFYTQLPVGGVAVPATALLNPMHAPGDNASNGMALIPPARAQGAGGPTPGGRLPGGSFPGGGMPGGGLPGGHMPGGVLPGGLPGGHMPGGGPGAMAGRGMPGGMTPGGTSPGAAMPGAAMPGGGGAQIATSPSANIQRGVPTMGQGGIGAAAAGQGAMGGAGLSRAGLGASAPFSAPVLRVPLTITPQALPTTIASPAPIIIPSAAPSAPAALARHIAPVATPSDLAAPAPHVTTPSAAPVPAPVAHTAPAVRPLPIPFRRASGGILSLASPPFIEGDFIAAARQADGTWLAVAPRAEPFPNRWQAKVMLWFILSLLVVSPLAWLFARRIVHPLEGFAKAAEALGRDPSATILPLSGPAEIGRAAYAFNQMRHRLRAFVDDRTAMVGAISHDLRTPLTRLRFRIEDVPEDSQPGLLKEVTEMEQIIAHVITFIRDAATPGPRETVDLGDLVAGSVNDARLIGGDVEFEQTARLPVEVDPVGMRRLLGNLLENAVKYGTHAKVRLTLRDGAAVAEVIDNGPGIPESEWSRVFEPFYRTEAARKSGKPGSGLGLAVCRSIARAHGGDVALERGEEGFVARVSVPLVLRDAA